MKNTKRTHAILQEWNESTVDIPELARWKWQWPPEQGAFDYFRKLYTHDIEIIEDYYMINAHYGQFIRHCTGRGPLHKFNMIKKIYHSPLMERNRQLLENHLTSHDNR
jgi:hypothetical protein